MRANVPLHHVKHTGTARSWPIRMPPPRGGGDKLISAVPRGYCANHAPFSFLELPEIASRSFWLDLRYACILHTTRERGKYCRSRDLPKKNTSQSASVRCVCMRGQPASTPSCPKRSGVRKNPNLPPWLLPEVQRHVSVTAHSVPVRARYTER